MMYTSVFTIWSVIVINISDWSRERLQIRQCCSSYWIWQDWSGNQHPRHQLTRSSNLLFALHMFLISTKLQPTTSDTITFLFNIYDPGNHHLWWRSTSWKEAGQRSPPCKPSWRGNWDRNDVVDDSRWLLCWYSWFILSPGDLLCSAGRKCNWCRWAGSRPNSNFTSESNVSGF